jgi:hypothetical protein
VFTEWCIVQEIPNNPFIHWNENSRSVLKAPSMLNFKTTER